MELYRAPPSIPCRSVLLCMRQLDLDVEVKDINLMEKEHLTDEYIAINPCHTIPTLVDGDTTLWESRAILGYLLNKYAPENDLYPTDPSARGQVDNLLYWDIGTLNTRFYGYVLPIMFYGEAPDESKLEKFMEAVNMVNTFLEGKDYLTGDKMTIADMSIISTITSAISIGLDISQDNVVAWVERCKEGLTGFDEFMEGASMLGEIFKSRLEQQ